MLKFLILVFLIAPWIARGQTENPSDLEKAPDSTSAGPNVDVDQLITNNYLRAESGSKSPVSIASSFSYNGGSIQSPLSENRPNIGDATGTITKAYLSGDISGKYNLNAKNSLMFGVGMRWIAPLEPGGPHNYSEDRFDADNPYLTYQHLYKWRGIQNIFTVTPTIFTNANLVAEGYVTTLLFDQESVYDLGSSGFSVGLSTWVQAGFFNKTGPLGQPGTPSYIADVRSDQSDYSFAFNPEIEYQMTEKLNWRLSTNIWTYEHVRSEPRAAAFHVDTTYLSLGLGYAVTRDIYLLPNIQFIPNDIRPSRTNVGLNAYINVF